MRFLSSETKSCKIKASGSGSADGSGSSMRSVGDSEASTAIPADRPGAVDAVMTGSQSPLADATRCPECHTPPHPLDLAGGGNVRCRYCGLWQLNTGESLSPRADDSGVFDRFKLHSPFWQRTSALPAKPNVPPPITRTERIEGDKLSDAPFVPLTSWADILAALNEPHDKPLWKNTEQTRDKILKLNEQHNGPIRRPQGKGTQPSVEKAALMTWWNGLKEHFDVRSDDAEAEAKSARLTVADSHNFGASGTVVPGIDGSVKRKRGTKNE